MMENRPIRWGLLGAGVILNRWLKGAMQPEGMEISAIASRTPETASAMAEKWSIPRVMTYDEMVSSPDIDVVYIPVPHQAHKELALKAMRGGKHVLVEKPAGVTAADWDEMTACAKANGVFLMEAFWTRFFPATKFLLQTIAEGRIGRVRLVQANFGSRVADNCTSRLVDPARAGGALLDIGVYDLQFAQMIYGSEPVCITGAATIGQDFPAGRVDETAGYVARYADGGIAVMAASIRARLDDTAYVYGDTGYITVPNYWRPKVVNVTSGGRTERFEFPVDLRPGKQPDEGFQYEVIHVNECVRAGLTESPVHTWAITASVMRQCDALRREWGLVYPFEKN